MNDKHENLKGLLGTLDALVGAGLDMLNSVMGIWFLIVVPVSLIIFGLYACGVYE